MHLQTSDQNNDIDNQNHIDNVMIIVPLSGGYTVFPIVYF